MDQTSLSMEVWGKQTLQTHIRTFQSFSFHSAVVVFRIWFQCYEVWHISFCWPRLRDWTSSAQFFFILSSSTQWRWMTQSFASSKVISHPWPWYQKKKNLLSVRYANVLAFGAVLSFPWSHLGRDCFAVYKQMQITSVWQRLDRKWGHTYSFMPCVPFARVL